MAPVVPQQIVDPAAATDTTARHPLIPAPWNRHESGDVRNAQLTGSDASAHLTDRRKRPHRVTDPDASARGGRGGDDLLCFGQAECQRNLHDHIASGLQGPISLTCLAPTAVSLSSLGANTPASSALTWWAAALAMAGLLLGVIIWQRQAQTR